MDNIDDAIKEAEEAPESFDKAKFSAFIKSSLSEIKKINESYKKLFESPEGQEPIIAEVEKRLEVIKNNYEQFFSKTELGFSKIDELNTKFEEIKKYHKELLDGDKSIKSDIQESQDKITEFYVYLFGGDDGVEGKEKQIKSAIEAITNFSTELTKDGGYAKVIEGAHKQILDVYNSFYAESEGLPSKISELKKQVEEIQDFSSKLKNELIPLLEEAKLDLQIKRKEADALLSDATVRSLADGYLESMCAYSKPKEKKYIGNSITLSNILIFLFNGLGRYLGTILNYSLFILPLAGVCFIFVNEHTASIILAALQANGSKASPLELIYVKTIISLPLIWIAWFGQKNISQRKRLFEEYNHKLRVVQMYLLLNSKGNPYNLDKTEEVGDILKYAIKGNPAQFLGDGETMVDHILEKFRIRGFYNNLKQEIVNELNPVNQIVKKDGDK